jgi:hypothetical protein
MSLSVQFAGLFYYLLWPYPEKPAVALQPLLELVQEVIDRPAAINSTRMNTLAFIFVVFKVKQYKTVCG